MLNFQEKFKNSVADITTRSGRYAEGVSLKANVGIDGEDYGEMRLSETVSYTSETTDSVLEDGSVISDHVVLLPTEITISGVVSALHRSSYSQSVEDVNRISKLSDPIRPYLPSWSSSEISKINSIYDSVRSTSQRIDRAINTAGYYEGLSSDLNGNFRDLSNQFNEYVSDRAYKFVQSMQSIQSTRKPVSVNTLMLKSDEGVAEYKKDYDNMVITNFEYSKTNENSGIEFSITFKQVRFFTSKVIDVIVDPHPEQESALSKPENIGVTTGDEVDSMTIGDYFERYFSGDGSVLGDLAGAIRG